MIGAFLLYLVAGYFVFQLFIDIGINKKKSWVITVALMILVPFGDVIPGKIYFSYICNKEGGMVIDKVVEVDGYLAMDSYSYGCSQGCIQRLVEWQKAGKPMFIEAFVDYPKEENFADKPGYYRFELVEKTPEACALQDSIMDRYPVRFGTYPVPDGYCLLAKAIENPTAEYSVESWKRDYHVSDLFGIVADHAYITQIPTGKIVASAAQYTYSGGWLRRSISKSIAVGQPMQCPPRMNYALGNRLTQLTFNE